MKSMKRYILLISALAAVAIVYAQKLTAEAPATVAVGSQFKITYKADTSDVDVEGFKMGSIPTGIEVLTGPSTSAQHNVSIVNGKETHTSSVTYTFIVIAEKEGEYTIPAAQATVKGQTIFSNVLHLKASGNAPNKNGNTLADSTPKAENTNSGSEIFIKASVSKQRVYEQEPVVLTYKLYTNTNLTQLDGKMPDLNGFFTKEIPLSQQKKFHRENVNGKPYNCVTWSRYVLFPQVSGKLEIPSVMYEGVVQQMNSNVDPFDAFFNGGSGYVKVIKAIKAPSVTIQVDSLPNQPKNFSGGVGKFGLSSEIDNTDVIAGDTVCLRVKVNGVGNMSLMDEPLVKFPKEIELCHLEVIDNTTLTSNGEQGEFYYDYRFVPHYGGDYDIPATKLTYFDSQMKKYHTIRSSGFTLHVTENPIQPSSVAAKEDDERGFFEQSLLQLYWPAVICVIVFVAVCLTVTGWLIRRKKKI